MGNLRKVVSANITISSRHCDMMIQLLPQYTEGAAFHLYHSIESLATAGIVARTNRRPERTHMFRIDDFHGSFYSVLQSETLQNFEILMKTMELMIKSRSSSDGRQGRFKVLYFDNPRQTEPKDLLTSEEVESLKKTWDDLRDTLIQEIKSLN